MAPRTAAKTAKSKLSGKLGALPEWNLADLYPAMDSPALKADLEKADADCAAFEQDFKGRLAALASGEPAALGAAVKRYEAIEGLLGRLGSFSGLLYAGNTTD